MEKGEGFGPLPSTLMAVSLDPGRKLLPEETPWRSACHVLGRHSADGNHYRPGDPIPAAEAVRQGLVSEADPTLARVVCTRCMGGGHYTNPVPKGHKDGCACKFCGPCPKCQGGFLTPDAVPA